MLVIDGVEFLKKNEDFMASLVGSAKARALMHLLYYSCANPSGSCTNASSHAVVGGQWHSASGVHHQCRKFYPHHGRHASVFLTVHLSSFVEVMAPSTQQPLTRTLGES